MTDPARTQRPRAVEPSPRSRPPPRPPSPTATSACPTPTSPRCWTRSATTRLDALMDSRRAQGDPARGGDAGPARAAAPRTRSPRSCAALADANRPGESMIGLGYHGTLTPPVIRRNVLEDPSWYTAYTPYQPEISQGRLEALLNFQTVVSDLTGLPTANSSLLDEATAAAEAMTLVRRANRKATGPFVVDADALPQTIDVRAHPRRGDGHRGGRRRPDRRDCPTASCPACCVQYPGASGRILDPRPVIEEAHARNALAVVAADLLALTLLEAPGRAGRRRRRRLLPALRRPALLRRPARRLHGGRRRARAPPARAPGRGLGRRRGPPGLPPRAADPRAAHPPRQGDLQHLHRPGAAGGGRLDVRRLPRARRAARDRPPHARATPSGSPTRSARAATTSPHEPFFDTLTVPAPGRAAEIVAAAREPRPPAAPGRRRHGGALDLGDDHPVHGGVGAARLRGRRPSASTAAYDDAADALHPRPAPQRPTTSPTRSSTSTAARPSCCATCAASRPATTRWTAGMIPLGSCTMKLNATTEMEPVSLTGFADLHPFAPAEDATGYRKLVADLEGWLAEVTGYDQVSIQPNAGSQGELAGLLAIRGYHRANGAPGPRRHPDPVVRARHQRGVRGDGRHAGGRGEGDRRRLGRPRRPARPVRGARRRPGRDHGHLPVDARRLRGHRHRPVRPRPRRTAARSTSTAPTSTRCWATPGRAGSAATSRTSTCTRPSASRTAAAAPGSGRSRCARTSRRSCPSHPLHPEDGKREGIGAISAAPYGSAGILPISWAYIRLMGAIGLTRATAAAVLSANYVAARLDEHFPVLYKGDHGLVAHECILDLRGLTKDTGVTVDDVAKRLDRLRLPRADDVVPGRRHADGGAHRVRGPRRDRPVLRRDDRDPARDRPGGGGGVERRRTRRCATRRTPPGRWSRSGTAPTRASRASSRPVWTPTSTGRRSPGSTRRTATATWSAPARRPRRSPRSTEASRPASG